LQLRWHVTFLRVQGSEYLCFIVKRGIFGLTCLCFHSFIPDIYIAPLQVHYYSEAPPTFNNQQSVQFSSSKLCTEKKSSYQPSY